MATPGREGGGAAARWGRGAAAGLAGARGGGRQEGGIPVRGAGRGARGPGREAGKRGWGSGRSGRVRVAPGGGSGRIWVTREHGGWGVGGLSGRRGRGESLGGRGAGWRRGLGLPRGAAAERGSASCGQLWGPARARAAGACGALRWLPWSWWRFGRALSSPASLCFPVLTGRQRGPGAREGGAAGARREAGSRRLRTGAGPGMASGNQALQGPLWRPDLPLLFGCEEGGSVLWRENAPGEVPAPSGRCPRGCGAECWARGCAGAGGRPGL